MHTLFLSEKSFHQCDDGKRDDRNGDADDSVKQSLLSERDLARIIPRGRKQPPRVQAHDHRRNDDKP